MRVAVTGVHYSYSPTGGPILKGASLEVPSGTAAAIVGPSGSGKTTLLALLGGLLRPQEGEIAAVDARGARHPLDQHAAWVLQTVSLLPDRTAVENAAVGAYADGLGRVEAHQRARAALAAVGLESRADTVARRLSGGEGQRVAIARALTSSRPIILADEPTGQLDAASSATVIEAMITAHGVRTLVVVTHDPEVAARCDAVWRLRDGQLSVKGP